MNPVEQFIANYEAFEYSHVSTDTVKFKTDLDAALVYVQRRNVLVRAKEEKTLRDELALKTLANLMTNNNKLSTTLKHNDYVKRISEIAYEYADAMMLAREK